MSVPIALLGPLEREPSYGYLKRDYDAYFGWDKPLDFGQVYATLARLTRDGKVAPGVKEAGGGPARKLYAITEDGKHEFETWLSQPIEPAPHL
jgi:DNA-binding PadR family transcriptional regulator